MRFLMAIYHKLKEKVEAFHPLSASGFNASFLNTLNLRANDHLNIEKNGLTYCFADANFSMIVAFASVPSIISPVEIYSFIRQGRKAVRGRAKQ